MSWIDAATQRIIELEGFIPEAKRVFKDEDNFTIGYGKNDSSVKAGQKISQAEAAEDLKLNLIPQKIKVAKRLFPNFDNFSDNLKVELLQGVFRGDFKADHQTVKHINKGDFNKASTEFLNNNEYRDAQLPDSGKAGIVPRMESISLAMKNEGTGMEIETTPRLRPDSVTVFPESMPQEVPQPKTFNQAFGEARQQQGSGGTFEWNGNSYSTNMAGEVPAVAEPMFPREEFVPTVPPRVTSTADSRINVPPFEGLEIPELGFNNGISSVPNYLEEIKSLTLAPPSMMSDIDEDQRRLQEMAIVNDVRNNYSVPPKVIDNNEIVQTELPPASVESDINQDRRNLQEMAIVNDLANKNNKEKVVPLVNNNINYTEYTTQAMTQQEAESILRDPNASEESRLNARKFFSGNFTVPSEIDNSVMTEEKAYSILQDPNASPLDTTKAQQFFGGIKPSEGRGKGEIEVAARKALTDGAIPEVKETDTNVKTDNNTTSTLPDGVTQVNLTSKQQSEIDKGTPNSVKEQVGGMLQTFFGLETSDVTRAVGFYLASRAAGYSHEGSMRWAGRTVLKQAENRNILNSKKSDNALTAFAKISGKYKPSAASKINKLLTEGKLVEAQTEMSKSSNMTLRGQMGISKDDAGTQMIRRGYTTPTTVFTGTNGIYYEKITGEKDGKTFETYKPLTTADSNQLRPLGASDRESDYINNARKILDEMPSGYFRQAGTDPTDSSGEEKPAGLFGAADKAGVLADIRRLSKELATKGVPNMPEALALKLSGLAQLAESQGIKAISASQLLEIGFSGSDSLIDSKLITKDGDEETIIPSAEIVDFTKKFREQFNNDYNTSNKNMSTIVTEYRQVKPSSVKVIEQLDEFKSLTDKQKEEVKSASNLFMSYALTKAYSNNK